MLALILTLALLDGGCRDGMLADRKPVRKVAAAAARVLPVGRHARARRAARR